MHMVLGVVKRPHLTEAELNLSQNSAFDTMIMAGRSKRAKKQHTIHHCLASYLVASGVLVHLNQVEGVKD